MNDVCQTKSLAEKGHFYAYIDKGLVGADTVLGNVGVKRGGRVPAAAAAYVALALGGLVRRSLLLVLVLLVSLREDFRRGT